MDARIPDDAIAEGISGSGHNLGRILALSDGVFGFSMTLLVITLALPAVGSAGNGTDLSAYLTKLLPSFLGYALAFLLVAGWWSAHHRLFSAIRRYDPTLVRWNQLFLLFISITPFALAILFAYPPEHFIGTGLSAKIAVALFAGIQAVNGFLLRQIWVYATREGRLVEAGLPQRWIDQAERENLTKAGIFLASIAIAFILPIAGELSWIAVAYARRAGLPAKVSISPPASGASNLRS